MREKKAATRRSCFRLQYGTKQNQNPLQVHGGLRFNAKIKANTNKLFFYLFSESNATTSEYNYLNSEDIFCFCRELFLQPRGNFSFTEKLFVSFIGNVCELTWNYLLHRDSFFYREDI